MYETLVASVRVLLGVALNADGIHPAGGVAELASAYEASWSNPPEVSQTSCRTGFGSGVELKAVRNQMWDPSLPACTVGTLDHTQLELSSCNNFSIPMRPFCEDREHHDDPGDHADEQLDQREAIGRSQHSCLARPAHVQTPRLPDPRYRLTLVPVSDVFATLVCNA